MDDKCKNCQWWRDYKDRVHARISYFPGKIARGVMELRRCHFNPHPSQVNFQHDIYTDEDYCCGEHKQWIEEKKTTE